MRAAVPDAISSLVRKETCWLDSQDEDALYGVSSRLLAPTRSSRMGACGLCKESRRLLTFFESAEEVLNHIEWAVSRYFQRNLYIIGNRCCFEGYKTEAAEGFDMTLCHTAHEALTTHINFYDSLFSKLSVRTLKDAYPGQQMRLGTRRASVALREVTKKSLAESLKFLKRHRDV